MGKEMIYRRLLTVKKASDELYESIKDTVAENGNFINLSSSGRISDAVLFDGVEGAQLKHIEGVRIKDSQLQIFAVPNYASSEDISDETLKAPWNETVWYPLHRASDFCFEQTVIELAYAMDEVLK